MEDDILVEGGRIGGEVEGGEDRSVVKSRTGGIEVEEGNLMLVGREKRLMRFWSQWRTTFAAWEKEIERGKFAE